LKYLFSFLKMGYHKNNDHHVLLFPQDGVMGSGLASPYPGGVCLPAHDDSTGPVNRLKREFHESIR
jgi:hypothetical protein